MQFRSKSQELEIADAEFLVRSLSSAACFAKTVDTGSGSQPLGEKYEEVLAQPAR
jgi:hypothetical protein